MVKVKAGESIIFGRFIFTNSSPIDCFVETTKDLLKINPAEESRYRDCIECSKNFKKPCEEEFRCERCRRKLKTRQHFNDICNDLQNANKVFR